MKRISKAKPEKQERTTSQRMCISCRKMFPKQELIRVVKHEEEIFVDKTNKFQARGAYLCHNTDCIALLYKNKALQRAFKCAISNELLENLLKECEG